MTASTVKETRAARAALATGAGEAMSWIAKNAAVATTIVTYTPA